MLTEHVKFALSERFEDSWSWHDYVTSSDIVKVLRTAMVDDIVQKIYDEQPMQNRRPIEEIPRPPGKTPRKIVGQAARYISPHATACNKIINGRQTRIWRYLKPNLNSRVK